MCFTKHCTPAINWMIPKRGRVLVCCKALGTKPLMLRYWVLRMEDGSCHMYKPTVYRNSSSSRSEGIAIVFPKTVKPRETVFFQGLLSRRIYRICTECVMINTCKMSIECTDNTWNASLHPTRQLLPFPSGIRAPCQSAVGEWLMSDTECLAIHMTYLFTVY